MNSTDYTAREFYKFPSVEVTYFLAAVLVLELIFLAYHMVSQVMKKSVIPRVMGVIEGFYLGLFIASIICTYYQQNDVLVSNTVFGIEVGIFLTDLIFTTTRSALFTSNKLILKRNHHLALLVYNIISIFLTPTLGAISYLTYDRSQPTKTYVLAGFTIIAYIANQVVNITVFLAITRFLSSQVAEDNTRNSELRNVKLYTLSLVLSGILSKLYVLGLNVVEGDLIFPWSQPITDGNLLCIYFIMTSWRNITRRIQGKKTSGKAIFSTLNEQALEAQLKKSKGQLQMKSVLEVHWIQYQAKRKLKKLFHWNWKKSRKSFNDMKELLVV